MSIIAPDNDSKIEKIGKVTLDYSQYSGNDLYCDGDIEDKLLSIVKANPGGDYLPEILSEKSWPVFYHLSKARKNIVSWLPISKSDKVLEVGSGCGAISGELSRKAGEVVSCDLSKKRSTINAYKNINADNLTIHVGNFTDVEKELPNDFDYILLIGVLEYGGLYISTDNPYVDFLKLLKKHLKPEGRIVIAIENRMGLKYLSGCKEDHLGTYFSGIEGYGNESGVRTFSKKGLIKLFEEANMQYQFFYPYPDYKFMKKLFSDIHLPKAGELNDNMRNFDQDRLLLFDEEKAFVRIIEDGSFDEYSNSFVCILNGKIDFEYVSYDTEEEGIYSLIGKNVLDIKSVTSKNGNHRIQVYLADENGIFCEENSFFVDNSYDSSNCGKVSVPITEGTKCIRIDPASSPCLVKILNVNAGNGKYALKKKVKTNGKLVAEGTYAFDTSDPNIIFDIKKEFSDGDGLFKIEIMTEILSDFAAKTFSRLK